MASPGYKDRLLLHLATYRREVLGVAEAGSFRFRGRDVLVEHVLPETVDRWLNIPEASRSTVRSAVSKYGVKLHRYFHHLNSSQAFALSLFVPFFENCPYDRILLQILGIEGGHHPN